MMILLLYLSNTIENPENAIQHSQTSVLHSSPARQQSYALGLAGVQKQFSPIHFKDKKTEAQRGKHLA